MTLHHGAWQDAPWPQEVDVIVTDPPYSQRTHAGQPRNRDELAYAHLSPRQAAQWGRAWGRRVRHWLCVLSCHELSPHWVAGMRSAGLYTFAPVPCVIDGSAPRMTGDGPASGVVWLLVARTRATARNRWGSLPSHYHAQIERAGLRGGKPLSLMRQIIRDYSRPGMLVADPCAGHATTLVAAIESGRRAWGCELDPAAHAAGSARLAGACPPTLPFDTAPEQASLLEIP